MPGLVWTNQDSPLSWGGPAFSEILKAPGAACSLVVCGSEIGWWPGR